MYIKQILKKIQYISFLLIQFLPYIYIM